MDRTKDEEQRIIRGYLEQLNSELARCESGLCNRIGLERVKHMQYGEPPSWLEDREAHAIDIYHQQVQYYCEWHNKQMKRLGINHVFEAPDPLPPNAFSGRPVPPHTFDGRYYDWDEQVLAEVKRQRAQVEAEAKKRAQADAEAREQELQAGHAAMWGEYYRRQNQNRK